MENSMTVSDILARMEQLRPKVDDKLIQRKNEILSRETPKYVEHGPADIVTGAKELAGKVNNPIGKVGMGALGAILGGLSSLNNPSMMKILSRTQGNPYAAGAMAQYGDEMQTQNNAYRQALQQLQANQDNAVLKEAGDQEKAARDYDLEAMKMGIQMLPKDKDKAAMPGGIDKELFDREMKLGERFMKYNTDFVTVRDAYSKIKSAKPTAAGDISLIYGFMKINDPGSTVREGEYATAQNAGGIPERVRAMYNNALSGQKLDENVRKDFKETASNLYKSQVGIYKKARKQAEDTTKAYGADIGRVLPDLLLDETDPEGIR